MWALHNTFHWSAHWSPRTLCIQSCASWGCIHISSPIPLLMRTLVTSHSLARPTNPLAHTLGSRSKKKKILGLTPDRWNQSLWADGHVWELIGEWTEWWKSFPALSWYDAREIRTQKMKRFWSSPEPGCLSSGPSEEKLGLNSLPPEGLYKALPMVEVVAYWDEIISPLLLWHFVSRDPHEGQGDKMASQEPFEHQHSRCSAFKESLVSLHAHWRLPSYFMSHEV